MDQTNRNVDVVLGAQWGDEGKGKLVDILSSHYDICCRCQGGNNAGHTIVHNQTRYKFHLCPSALINEKSIGYIGSGCVVDIISLFEEIEELTRMGLKDIDKRLKISNRAHLIFNNHIEMDKLGELNKNKKIGTTNKGIGPCYAEKMNRNNIRVCDLLNPATLMQYLTLTNNKNTEMIAELVHKLEPMVVDGVYYLHNHIKNNKKILVEGANALMLDIDYGTYPFVTSSNCSIGGVLTGLAIPPNHINTVFGVVKAYCTRVGEGPFPTELTDNETGAYLQKEGQEIGTTTGRTRRCGWLDLVQLKYSCLVNNYTYLNITKLDVLDKLTTIKVGISYSANGTVLECYPANAEKLANVNVEYKTFEGWNTPISHITNYKDLPENAKIYLQYIQEHTNVPIKYIGVGSSRDQMIIN